MRSAWEQDLLACRSILAKDPGKAVRSAADLLRLATSSCERVRATLTAGSANAAMGGSSLLKEAIEQAASFRTPGALARSELAAFRARLHLTEGDPDAALKEAETAVRLAAPLAAASPDPRGRRFSAASTIPRSTFAAVLIRRAEANLELRAPAPALEDAISALSWVDQRYTPYTHVAGILAVGTCLVQPGIATPDSAVQVLRICEEADTHFSRRRIGLKSPHRLQVRGLRALALATLGSLERAEAQMLYAIDHLHQAGHQQDVDNLLGHLVWIIGHRAGQYGRAALLAKRYGASGKFSQPSCTPLPNQSQELPFPDDEPIGF